MSKMRTDTLTIDRGEVMAAFEMWIIRGNYDRVKALLNEPWANTTAGRAICAEAERTARQELAERTRRQKQVDDNSERNDPMGLRYCSQ